MIKAIIFDVDGVLIDLTIEKAKYQLQRDWGITPEQTEPFFTNEFIACLKGEADLKESVAPYLQTWGWNDSINAYLDYWFESQKDINKELIAEIQLLKNKGYKIYVATNQEKHRAEYLSHKLGFGEIFDGFYSSSQIGEIKNEPTFFRRLLEQIKLKPSEVLFWDDGVSHVESAKSIGIKSELYTDFKKFKKTMENYLR